MLQWLSAYVPDWVAAFLISLLAAFWGVATRLNHAARRAGEKVKWRDYVLEIPTMVGMAIIAGPIGKYLNVHYGVDIEVVFALTYVFGYIGARLIDRVVAVLEKKARNDEDSQ